MTSLVISTVDATFHSTIARDLKGWIDAKTGVYHAVFHCGNGADSAGCHRYR